MLKYYRKKDFIKKMWPANLVLNSLTSIDMFSCPGGPGTPSDCGVRGPEFDSWLLQGFLCFRFCFDVVDFTFFVQKHYFVMKFCNSFCNVDSFSMLNILQIL